jgi:ubiquinone biosynthesis protein
MPWERKPELAEGETVERLSAALQSLGPAYIKLGQVLATRPDIIGIDAAEDLQSLQDKMPPFSDGEARRRIEAELGETIDFLFESLGPPIAAASIAQVHRGKIRADAGHNRHAGPLAETDFETPKGEPLSEVAVKVLRPGIKEQFDRDLDSFFFAARSVEKLSAASKRLRPVELVQTLADSVKLEMDLRVEAAAASELAGNTSDDDAFRIPRIDWARTSESVLTIEWVDGIPISQKEQLADAGTDLSDLAIRVIQCFLRQSLRDGFFHADMHQGNLLVDRDGNLVAIDFGIMGRLDAQSRRFLAETLFGFLTRDYHRVADVHFEAGFVPKHQSRDAFAQALRAIGEPIFGRNAQDISMARLLAQLFQTTENFDMKLQPQLVLLQKTMMVVEGVARKLDPNHNIWEASRPVIEEWMERQLGPEGRIASAAENAVVMGRVLTRLPQFFDSVEQAAAHATQHGLRLDAETAREIGEAEARASRSGRMALWIAAVALVVIAISVI